jgi:hypothetical protein
MKIDEDASSLGLSRMELVASTMLKTAIHLEEHPVTAREKQAAANANKVNIPSTLDAPRLENYQYSDVKELERMFQLENFRIMCRAVRQKPQKMQKLMTNLSSQPQQFQAVEENFDEFSRILFDNTISLD